MTIGSRLLVLMAIFALALCFYGAARYYSPLLVRHVVEQSLIQKAPAGINEIVLQDRFRALLSAAPDRKTEMDVLLRISGCLEKVQRLTPEELDSLMADEKPGMSGGL
jgi:hypothetical protein